MAKIAIVTGGSGALGRAVVQELADAGYVLHAAVLTDAEQSAWRGAGSAHVVDLRDLEATRRWLQAVGRVDAAALCAGGFAMESLEALSAEHLDGQLDVNLRTAVNTLSALVPVLRPEASVVLVGTQAYRGAAGKAIYAASKAAVVSLTRSAAAELRERRVRVNAILPDTIDTPANRAAMPDANFDAWAKPAELARVIAFLCSDAARVVSGNAIAVGR